MFLKTAVIVVTLTFVHQCTASYGVQVNLLNYTDATGMTDMGTPCDADGPCDFNIWFCLDNVGSDEMNYCQTGWFKVATASNQNQIDFGHDTYGSWGNPHTYYYTNQPNMLYCQICVKDRDGLVSQERVDFISGSVYADDHGTDVWSFQGAVSTIFFNVNVLVNQTEEPSHVWFWNQFLAEC